MQNCQKNDCSISTHKADARCRDDPAELPPSHGVVTDHVLNAIVEAAYTKRPGDGDALEEDQEQETEAGHCIWVENLEYVHSTLEKSHFYKNEK